MDFFIICLQTLKHFWFTETLERTAVAARYPAAGSPASEKSKQRQKRDKDKNLCPHWKLLGFFYNR